MRHESDLPTPKPTFAEQIGAFAARAQFKDVPSDALDLLKRDLLDALGCALGALDGPPIRALRDQIDEFGGAEQASLIGGGKTSVDRAARYNTALTRYLDFMDSFLAKGETCHPSDNIGSVLAAAETKRRSGRDFLTALALAYEVQIRLTEAAPVMSVGFDHTTQLGMSIAVGATKALDLDAAKISNALEIVACDFASLAVIRSSPTSQWKGLASSAAALAGTNVAFLAARGVTGPRAVFEGPRGWFSVVGKKAKFDWADRQLASARRLSLKKYNAEVHTQTALDALMDLVREHDVKPDNVDRIDFETVQTTYDIVGGGAYGDRKVVENKEQADHSLPYLAAVAVLDREVWPEQFAPARIKRDDVQQLLRRVHVRTHARLPGPKTLVERIDPYSRVYPQEMPVRCTIKLKRGGRLSLEKRRYEGFHDSPMTWEMVIAKFDRLAGKAASEGQRAAIVDTVRTLDKRDVMDLTRLLRLEARQPSPVMAGRAAAGGKSEKKKAAPAS
jgi:2-methylcitrate dehydratase